MSTDQWLRRMQDAEIRALQAVVFHGPGDLVPDDFDVLDHRRVFNHLCLKHAHGEVVEVFNLEFELVGHGIADLRDRIVAAPNDPTHRDALKELARTRRKADACGKLRVACISGDADRIAVAQDELDKAMKGTNPSRLWRPLSEWADLNQAPASREWVLRSSVGGWLPKGKAGMLVGGGGIGKTQLLLQLAVSVVTEKPFLDHYTPPRGGKVVVVLGEEDEEEVHRRIFNVSEGLGLSARERDALATAIVALPMAGKACALTEVNGAGGVSRTEFQRELVRNIKNDDIRLVCLDPLSRFASVAGETDNAMATRFVQAVEELTQVGSKPTVIVAHHSNKAGRAKGSSATSSNARGASALTDGFRWVAEVREDDDGQLGLKVVKTNYTRPGEWLPIRKVMGNGERWHITANVPGSNGAAGDHLGGV